MDTVECQSSAAYLGRPIFLTWGGQRLEIEIILSEWRTPEARCYRVQTRDRRLFDLSYLEAGDRWQIQPISGG
jgi:hypothetical protein